MSTGSPVISVQGLGKRYSLGARASYTRLTETVTHWATAPLRMMRNIGGPANSGSSLPDHIWSLRNVSFDVHAGEVIGIIGRNGAGKSTLLKLLSRITEPTEGKAIVCGRVGSLLEVGTGFHPELSGRENIFLNGAILGMSRREIARKFDEIVAFAEVERFLDTPVKRYSSGMYMRLAFAVAAHLEPEILIVDEVLAVGDASFQKKSMGRMGELAGGGRTVLFVSHNMSAIRSLCTRCLLLQQGQLISDGSPDQVTEQYLQTTNLDSSGIVRITASTRRVNSLDDSKFKFTSARIANTQGQATGLIAYGEPIEIQLTGEAFEDLRDVRAGFAIATPMGAPLFNSFQIDHGLTGSMKRGHWEFRIQLSPNLLAPGGYELHLGASGPGVTEWVPEVLGLHIDSAPWSPEKIWPAHGHGFMSHPCNWSMRQIDAREISELTSSPFSTSTGRNEGN